MRITRRSWGPEEDPRNIQQRTLKHLRDTPQVDPREKARKLQRDSLTRIHATLRRPTHGPRS